MLTHTCTYITLFLYIWLLRAVYFCTARTLRRDSVLQPLEEILVYLTTEFPVVLSPAVQGNIMENTSLKLVRGEKKG